jgi:hypothetical protein
MLFDELYLLMMNSFFCAVLPVNIFGVFRESGFVVNNLVFVP